jgi:hypothetical protein
VGKAASVDLAVSRVDLVASRVDLVGSLADLAVSQVDLVDPQVDLVDSQVGQDQDIHLQDLEQVKVDINRQPLRHHPRFPLSHLKHLVFTP